MAAAFVGTGRGLNVGRGIRRVPRGASPPPPGLACFAGAGWCACVASVDHPSAACPPIKAPRTDHWHAVKNKRVQTPSRTTTASVQWDGARCAKPTDRQTHTNAYTHTHTVTVCRPASLATGAPQRLVARTDVRAKRSRSSQRRARHCTGHRTQRAPCVAG